MHFPGPADALLHSLDPSYQKLLHGETPLSNSSSSHSLHSLGLGRAATATPSSGYGPSSLPVSHQRGGAMKIGSSSENLSKLPVIPNRKLPVYASRSAGVNNGSTMAGPSNIRSNSAIDLQAANRAVRNMRSANLMYSRK